MKARSLSLRNKTARADDLLAARSGMCDQREAFTASVLQQTMQQTTRRRQRRRRRGLNQQRRKQTNQQRQPPAESYRSWEQEPRSCCRRRLTPMQRQKRLKQVWSSSIDTPKIFNDKSISPSVLSWGS